MATSRRMADADPRRAVRQAVHLPQGRIRWLNAEARRQGRSISWLVRRALDLAEGQIERFPSEPREAT